ncbi:DctP family TRAP transporter solute-binding subunit [Mesobacillus subterraneus]|uniref:DctP family TRAP transporter solute-binding subunit n=2 Tax=Mesobacillus subterraneus TaxID=285983 RepID=A0A427TYC3_9BACI|nr:DctP family TRAP transporter solute-binding subunit [Mesobacillus subterraneus]
MILMLVSTSLILSSCQPQNRAVDHEQISREERIVIRFSHIVGEKTPKGMAARRFASLVKEKSNGFVEVQVFPNGYLYRDGEEIDGLLKNDIQMIAPATAKITSFVPEWQALDLPFAFNSIGEVHEYLEGEIGSKLMYGLQREGFYPLGLWDNGFKQMTNMTKPLTQPRDFRGLKFRIMPSEIIRQQFLELEAGTQSNSFNEVYQLLEKNKIDGQENTYSNIVSKRIHTQQKYLTASNHGYLGYVVLLKKEFWDQLPEEVQKILQESIKEVTDWEKEMARKMNEESLQELKDCKCVEIHFLSKEEKRLWEEALKPIYQRFEDRFGAEYINQLPRNKGAEH